MSPRARAMAIRRPTRKGSSSSLKSLLHRLDLGQRPHEIAPGLKKARSYAVSGINAVQPAPRAKLHAPGQAGFGLLELIPFQVDTSQADLAQARQVERRLPLACPQVDDRLVTPGGRVQLAMMVEILSYQAEDLSGQTVIAGGARQAQAILKGRLGRSGVPLQTDGPPLRRRADVHA